MFVPGTGDRDQIYFIIYHSGEGRAHCFSFSGVLRQNKNKQKPFLQIDKQRYLNFVSWAEKNVQNVHLVGEVDMKDIEMR